MRLPLQTSQVGPWRAEADTLARAFAGAFLFGMPLLFTMEMWWIGESLGRTRLGLFVVAGLLVNVGLAYYAGFRHAPRTFRHSLFQGIESLAIGVAAALATLFALGQLTGDGSLEGMLGMIIIQAVPLSLGASVANIVFADANARSIDEGGTSTAGGRLLNDVLATAAGAVFLGFAIAPTEEIPMLATGLDGWFVIGAVGLTLLVSYVIVFASGFDPEERDSDASAGLFQHPFSETVLAYFVALVVSAALLIAFGQVGTDQPLLASLTQVIVLAIPASIGGAAGRLVV